MNINIYSKKVNLSWDGIHSQLKLLDPPEIIKKEFNKIKIRWDIKLELHLRNSEVIGIPVLYKSWLDLGIKIISHGPSKPLSGTHDGIYFTLVDDSNSGIFDSIDWNKFIEGFTILFMSKRYCQMVLNKESDGLRSAKIEAEIINS